MTTFELPEIQDSESYENFVKLVAYGELHEIIEYEIHDGEVEYDDVRHELERCLNNSVESLEIVTYNFPAEWGRIVWYSEADEDYVMDVATCADTPREVLRGMATTALVEDVRRSAFEQLEILFDEGFEILMAVHPSLQDFGIAHYGPFELRRDTGGWVVYFEESSVEHYTLGAFRHNHDRPEFAVMESLDSLKERILRGDNGDGMAQGMAEWVESHE